MTYDRLVGDVPPTRHTQHRRPDGGLYYEELMGEEAFSSDSSLLHHRYLPSSAVSLHPGGHSHGPQPGAYERSVGAEFFDELAVMVDTFRPLELGEGGHACEEPGYAWTWAGRGPA